MGPQLFWSARFTKYLAESRYPREGTGTSPDYLVNRVLNKIEGPLWKKIARKSRNGCLASGGGVEDIV